ncbi:mitochondrial 37S ribosomal protein rsm10 [Coemansia sp. RSA 1939]|nr:mitochondrial 37S ribosomal protein rsm10 [Coemansia sp. RSA 1939]KAJ2609777.1 mitochondrial 37S ribosomal protein rsm10 [Coemansia sp. RSA 1804]
MFQPAVYRASAGCTTLRALCGKQTLQTAVARGLRSPEALRGVRTEATYAKLLDKALGFKVREFVKVDEKYLDDPLYQKAPRVEKTHGVRVCRVAFHTFQLERIDFYMDFVLRAAYHMGIPIAGPVSMPVTVRRWTVLKSPFVHKSSMEVFERRTHKRVVVLYDADMEVVRKWLSYINENIPVGIGMRYWLTEYETLGISAQIEKALKAGEAANVDPNMVKDTKYAQRMARRGRKLLWTTYKDLPTFSRSSVESIAMSVVEKLRADPTANIRDVTRGILSRPKKQASDQQPKEQKGPESKDEKHKNDKSVAATKTKK